MGLIIIFSASVMAQRQRSSQNHFADITGTIGSSQGTPLRMFTMRKLEESNGLKQGLVQDGPLILEQRSIF